MKNWFDLYWRAYEWGANEQRLRGHQLDSFASAYADIYEASVGPARPPRAFWTLWLHGHIVPNPSGTYRYEEEVPSCRYCHSGVWDVA